METGAQERAVMRLLLLSLETTEMCKPVWDVCPYTHPMRTLLPKPTAERATEDKDGGILPPKAAA